ncbi:MAG TPA: YfcE family phosphodiesterase [Phycisphaerales bacterium]|nr:YfcE family phosphodiesterase [Phycisphaerales bacterium]HMP37619.1 YfcE family phosphodiesterase [Phycisphaerales bacterium]
MSAALIGLLSDSHGQVARARRAVEVLSGRGASLLLHVGDIGGEPVLEVLAGSGCRVVFGNCDDEVLLARQAERLGIPVDHPVGKLELAGRRLVYSHGHLPHLLDAALREGVDYAIHGHTHALRDERIGATRVINPGALHRAPRYTVALLDVALDRLEVIDLEAAG